MDGEACRLQSTVGYNLWSFKESDATERLHFHFLFRNHSSKKKVAWHISSCWEKKIIMYPVKLSYKSEGEIETFLDKNWNLLPLDLLCKKL